MRRSPAVRRSRDRAADASATAATRADDLYSRSARRRIAGYLRMRMLELRLEGLGRAADVIEGRSPIRTLFEEDGAHAPYI